MLLGGTVNSNAWFDGSNQTSGAALPWFFNFSGMFPSVQMGGGCLVVTSPTERGGQSQQLFVNSQTVIPASFSANYGIAMTQTIALVNSTLFCAYASVYVPDSRSAVFLLMNGNWASLLAPPLDPHAVASCIKSSGQPPGWYLAVMSGTYVGASGCACISVWLQPNIETNPASTVLAAVIYVDRLRVTLPISVYPDYAAKFLSMATRVSYRSLSGREFIYEYARFRSADLPFTWVGHLNAITINSWWGARTVVVFDEPSNGSSYMESRIVGPQGPFANWMQQNYEAQYGGALRIEEV